MYIIFSIMKLRYLLLCIGSVGLVLVVPHIKTMTQGVSGLGTTSATQTATQTPDQPKTKEQIAGEIFQRLNPAVVTVYCGSEIGSGSIVTPSGLVLTTKHVVWETPEIKVKTADGKTYQGWLKAIDPQYDLALVQLDTKDTFPTVPLAKTLGLKAGETVHAIGSPAGKAGTLTTGTYTGTNQYGSLKTSNKLLEPGNSGGPLLNNQGEMVGVNKGLLPDGSGLATSVTIAQKLIDRNQRMEATRK
jgi:S1-C subfamily serine protease